MIELKFKLILISRREVLADAIHSLLHLAMGEESELVSFLEFEEALEKAPLTSSDLLLLEADDLVLQRLRKLRDVFQHGSVVVLTERADHDLGLACVRAGAHDYITLEEISPGSLFRSLRFAIERRKVQQALQNSQAQLSQAYKMEAIGRMASGLAHDFRQYIQVIVGNSRVLERLCTGDENIEQLVQDISEAGHGANELVGQVLDFARQGPSGKKPIELSQAILANKSMVKSFGKKISVDFLLHSEPLLFEGDAVQLGQIVLNLTINAVDACGDKGSVQVASRPLHLERRYQDESLVLKPGNYVLLDVRDSGPGIPLEVRDKIFDPFFTTKPRGKGTGLGLSTVYSIARGLDGQVTYWTRIGQGTTFTVIIPALDQSKPSFERVVDKPVGFLSSDAQERSLIRQDLRALGCPFTELNSFDTARQWVQKHDEARLILGEREAAAASSFKDCAIVLSALIPKDPDIAEQVVFKPYSLQQLAQKLWPSQG